LNQAFESSGKASGFSNGITRRSFLKRTGAASVATLVAWNLTSQSVDAENENPPSSAPWWVMRCTSLQPGDLLFDGFKHYALSSKPLFFNHLMGDATVALTLYSSVAVDPPEVGYNYIRVFHEFMVEVNSHDKEFDSVSISGSVSFDVSCDGLTGTITSAVSQFSSYPSPVGQLVGTMFIGNFLGDKYKITAETNPDALANGQSVMTTVYAHIQVYDLVLFDVVAEFNLPIVAPLAILNRFESRLT